MSARALLLLDNAPGHPKEEDLRSEDNLIQVLFMPPNTTPLLQPMDQNVIQQIKINYKKSLLSDVIKQSDGIIKFLKKTNIKDVVYNLAHSWGSQERDYPVFMEEGLAQPSCLHLRRGGFRELNSIIYLRISG